MAVGIGSSWTVVCYAPSSRTWALGQTNHTTVAAGSMSSPVAFELHQKSKCHKNQCNGNEHAQCLSPNEEFLFVLLYLRVLRVLHIVNDLLSGKTPDRLLVKPTRYTSRRYLPAYARCLPALQSPAHRLRHQSRRCAPSRRRRHSRHLRLPPPLCPHPHQATSRRGLCFEATAGP